MKKISQDKWFLLWSFAVVLVAIFLRFHKLTLKPLHHDEGVNGYFLTTLFSQGIYKYDPSNYHGPTLYYIALVFTKLLGLETFSIRTSVAIFGVLMVILVLFLRDYLGRIGSLSAAAFLAITPGMVYVSRYFIHEIFFVFCSLVLVVSFLYFLEGRKPGIFSISTLALILFVSFIPSLNVISLLKIKEETAVIIARIIVLSIEAVLVYLILQTVLKCREGLIVYPMIFASFLALLFATKETAFITIGTMTIALVCIWVWKKIYSGMLLEKQPQDDLSSVDLTWSVFKKRFGSKKEAIMVFLICLATSAYVGAVFFSSFFSYPRGIVGAFEAYSFWAKTGVKDHIGKATLYLEWLWMLEYPLVLLSTLGIIIAFSKAKHRFAMFTGLWAFGLFLAYSIIPYKTPWLILSFLLPMCMISGYAINGLISSQSKLLKTLGVIFLLASLVILSYNSYELNFRRYDDDSLTYVYAHTKRDFLKMIDQINYYAEKSGKGNLAVIQIVSSEYWPLPWYLKDYEHANFYGRIIDPKDAELIVAEKGKQDLEVFRRYRTNYKVAGVYPLRPGVDLILLVHKDLADENAKPYEEILKVM